MLINSYLGGWRWAQTMAILSVSLVQAFSQDTASSFDPAKGFKPAQRDMAEIALQLARSLQTCGSPVPYLRHMLAEHNRIQTEYRQKFKTEPAGYCPQGMDEEWMKEFSSKWDILSPKLGMEALTRKMGRELESSLRGSDGKPTVVVRILEQRQDTVIEAMRKGQPIPRFGAFIQELASRLALDKSRTGFNNLPERDREAAGHAFAVQESLATLFGKLDAALTPQEAQDVKDILSGMMLDTALMADSEFKVGMIAWAMSPDDHSAQATPYSAEMEKGLTESERKKLAAFLKKPRFTKADFAALDSFYKESYDKLSERGKDEMSHRIWSGVRGK